MKIINFTSNLPLPKKNQYRTSVERFLIWKGDKGINEEILISYFDDLIKILAPNTVRLAKSSIKNWLLNNHRLKNDLRFRSNLDSMFKEIKVPKKSYSLPESKILSESEIQEIISLLTPKLSLVIECLYENGARIGELLSVKLTNCRILKNHVEVLIIGKGLKEGILIIRKELFKDIKKAYKGKVYLFENNKGIKPISKQYVSKSLQDVGLKIGRAVHAHQFRHSRITHLLKIGKLIDAVSKFARHYDAGFTAKVYGHNQLNSNEIIESSIKYNRRNK